MHYNNARIYIVQSVVNGATLKNRGWQVCAFHDQDQLLVKSDAILGIA